ncbi:hypothetical protein [Chryseolinea soli]|uniref:Peptidase S41 n=1 Tax=Chryseolinea soli TaxID=2321403 RepID=A0A385SS50_9BACT|nr:hypothetical protein [Chryseolinea soli]AYB31638.1 hypothetical protein D4L85_14155 [Chryseolinea soli]
MKTKLLLLLALSTLISCEAQRVTHWKEDMDFWLGEVKKQHYVYRSEELPPPFKLQFEKVKSNLNTYSDQRILFELLGLSALLGDGHTYVLPWGAEGIDVKALPLRFYLFADGLFVIDAQPGYEKWIGKRVDQFGAVSAEKIMKDVGRFISRDNDQGINWIGPFMLSLEGMLQALGVDGKGTYSLTFDEAGQKVKQQFPVVPFQPVRGIPKLIPSKTNQVSVPLYLQHVEQAYWIKSLKNEKTVYVQFNQVMNDQNESLAQFSKRLDDSVKALGPEKLVVDVRHNNGGNADLLDPFLQTLQRFKSSSAKAQLYILTGRNTFSAAQIFISKADLLLKPVFAGEMSSSKPNFVGEENGIQLPHSKAICSISNRYHESIPGDHRQGIEPQMKILLTSTDYFNGRDLVLEEVLKQH